MAILQLMAARGWSKAQAGRRFLVTDETVASWNGRIEEDGPGALVEATVPVNKFPDFVAAMVTKLNRLFPVMGRRRIADFLAQFWPFCWWLAVVIDHWSRRSLGLAAFKRRPTADEICIMLDEAARRAGGVPKYTVSDQGSEFGEEYLEWCDDHDVRARFGAVGRHGSIAVEERFIRTLKQEGLAHEIVPLRHTAFCASLARFEDWYNEIRPHSSMGGATPDEVFHGRRPANCRRRFEPRARYPAKGACAAPWAPARAKIGARLDLVATPFRGSRHLAQIEIRRGD